MFGDRCFFPSSAHGHFQSIHYAIFLAENMNFMATSALQKLSPCQNH
ncbi:hypothetical protein RPHASCH2410_PD04060 (plasmid) [Rhizobium phaseoli Ch24-10]|nr:hypothetical protein RPHASCH2410_PD04060 [Rhizobium phaseoli Ch24-10]